MLKTESRPAGVWSRTPSPTPPSPLGGGRLDAVDLLRGLVMVLMALDHVRDYMCNLLVDPVNLNLTTPGLFLTRWVTHYCAPTFIFLAGTGAFLYGSRGKTTGQLSWFLLSRGLWILLLELTAVRLGWQFNVNFYENGGGTLWAIGLSMVCLSGLVWMPVSFVAALGVVFICFHNLLDGRSAAEVGLPDWLWVILHYAGPEGFVVFPKGFLGLQYDVTFNTNYCLIPWLGTMAAGYGCGALWLLDRPTRRRQFLGLGLAVTLTFIAFRAANLYGDAELWREQGTGSVYTALSFLNCTKYPASFMYLTMTLGPGLMLLALFDRELGWLARPLIVFGRVPMFFYLIHIPLIHALTVALDHYRFGWSPLDHSVFVELWKPEVQAKMPEGYGLTLPQTYLMWLGVLIVLYPLCLGFAALKRRHRDAWWVSYL